MMMLDALIALGVIVIGTVCYWTGFKVGRLTSRK
jgi:hypothetical protein